MRMNGGEPTFEVNVGRAALNRVRRAAGRDPTRGRSSIGRLSHPASMDRHGSAQLSSANPDRFAPEIRARNGRFRPAAHPPDPEPARAGRTLARGEDAVDPLPRRGGPGGGMARSARDRVGRPAVPRRAARSTRSSSCSSSCGPAATERSSPTPSRPVASLPLVDCRLRDPGPPAPALARPHRTGPLRRADPPDPALAAPADRAAVLEVDAAAFDEFWRLDDARARPGRPGDAALAPAGHPWRSDRAATACSAGPSGPGTCNDSPSTRARRATGSVSALLTDGLHWMRLRGARSAFVNTQVDNERALHLYEQRRLPATAGRAVRARRARCEHRAPPAAPALGAALVSPPSCRLSCSPVRRRPPRRSRRPRATRRPRRRRRTTPATVPASTSPTDDPGSPPPSRPAPSRPRPRRTATAHHDHHHHDRPRRPRWPRPA